VYHHTWPWVHCLDSCNAPEVSSIIAVVHSVKIDTMRKGKGSLTLTITIVLVFVNIKQIYRDKFPIKELLFGKNRIILWGIQAQCRVVSGVTEKQRTGWDFIGEREVLIVALDESW
jgi:hypothetical protein